DGSRLDSIETDEIGFDANLSDGSRLALAPHTALLTLANGATEVALRFEGGQASFAVKPHGPRRWSIDCGLAEVEVVGTRFTIDRSPTRVRVEVEEGVVRVLERSSKHVQNLVRGESIEISARPGAIRPDDPRAPALDARSAETGAARAER